MSGVFVNPFTVNIPLTPDFDTIHDELQRNVTNDGDIERIWTDVITAAVGSYILRMVSSFTADLAFMAERVQHETMLHTARRPSSVYAIAANHGVHLQRKLPGSIEVRLTRSTSLEVTRRLPAYTQWSVGDTSYFNRNDVVFPSGMQNISVTLHRGTVQQDTVTSTGKANQSYILDVDQFRVSDADLFCTIDGVKWPSTRRGLWQTNALKVFYEQTTIDGRVRVSFGDGVYGAIPRAGAITFSYVVVQTSDYDASKDLNPISLASPVKCSDDTIYGVTMGEVSAIIPEKTVEYYQRNAPYIASGRKRANTRANLRATALEYPGVIDAQLLGQAELNPQDLRQMNGIAAYLLTSTTWGAVNWNQFVAYMHSESDSTRHIYRRDPTKVVVNYDIEVELADRAVLAVVKQQIKDKLAELHAVKEGVLGASYALTHTSKLLLDAVKDPYGGLITYMDIRSPNNLQLARTQYAVLGSVNISEGRASTAPRIVSGVSVPGGRIGITG